MQEIRLKIRYFERGLKALNKVTLFFSFEPSPFQWTKFSKKGPRNSDQSLFRLQHKFRKNLLLVMYYMTKSDVI